MDTMQQDRSYFGFALSTAPVAPNGRLTSASRLQLYNLPLIHDEAELAAWLHIPLTRLRWLTHDKLDDSVWHYVRYSIPKRNGGVRVILAPKKELKQLQRLVLRALINRAQPKLLSEAAHGFVPRRSIVTNAQNHVQKGIVLRMDLEGFFPSIAVNRVRNLFMQLGYSLPVASTLALLCTERDRMVIVHDGIPHYVSNGPRHLVQGAPTSPALANLIAHELDIRMEELADRYGLTYTRYADDLTYSGMCACIPDGFLRKAQAIISEQGFQINKKKTDVARNSSRQMITGIVVNDEPSTPRKLRRKLRVILHKAEAEGFAAQNRDDHPNFEEHIQGLISFVESVNPRQGIPLRDAFQRAHFATLRCQTGDLKDA